MLWAHTVYKQFQNTVNSEIFARIFIFANSVKRHICDVKIFRLVHDLLITLHVISVNYREISPFREDFIFTKLRENKTLTKIFESIVKISFNSSLGSSGFCKPFGPRSGPFGPRSGTFDILIVFLNDFFTS